MQININGDEARRYEKGMSVVAKKVGTIAQSITESNVIRVQKQKTFEPFDKILSKLNLEEQKFVFYFLIELQRSLHPKSINFLKFEDEGIVDSLNDLSKSSHDESKTDDVVFFEDKLLPEVFAKKSFKMLKLETDKRLAYSSFVYLTLIQNTLKKICENDSVSADDIKMMLECMIKHFEIYSKKSVVPDFAENHRYAVGGGNMVKFFIDTFSLSKRNKFIGELPWGPMVTQSAQDQCYLNSLKLLAGKLNSYDSVGSPVDYYSIPFVYFSKNFNHKKLTNADSLLKDVIDYLEKDVNIKLNEENIINRAEMFSKLYKEEGLEKLKSLPDLIKHFESGRVETLYFDRNIHAKTLFMIKGSEEKKLKLWECVRAVEEQQLLMLKTAHPEFRKVFTPLLHSLQEEGVSLSKLSDEYSEKLKKVMPFFAMYALPSIYFFKMYECLNDKNKNELKQMPLSYYLNDKIAHWLCKEALGTEKEEERKKEIITCCALAAKNDIPAKDKWLVVMASILGKDFSWKKFAETYFDQKVIASTEALIIHRETSAASPSVISEITRNRIRL